MRKFFAVLLMPAFLMPAFLMLVYAGGVRAGMEKPPELAGVIQAQKPYGEGAYTWMGFTAYDASLWTDAPQWSMQAAFALSLRYGMHFTTQELVQRSLDEMQHIQRLSPQEKADYKTKLAPLFPPVKKGDVITALYTPENGAIFYYNGRYAGQIADPVFARRFLSIWLSEETSAPELRKALLKIEK